MKYWIFLLIVCSIINCASGDECNLPEKWWGSWVNGDSDDSATPVSIQRSKLSTAGDCIKSQYDFYIFKHDLDGRPCYKCLYILEKHRNVLQYKENPHCMDEASFDLCREEIDSSQPLISLFRDIPTHEICPFGITPFKFNYRNDHGICDKSYVDTCSVNTSMLFRYEACYNMAGSESYQEQLTCFASWKDGDQNYLVGRVSRIETHIPEGRSSVFRCFNYGSTRLNSSSDSAIIGYKFSRSDPYGSCAHVPSPVFGSRIYNLEIVSEEVKCEFPEWVYDHQWESMNLTFKIIASDKSSGKIRVRRIISSNGTLSEDELHFVCKKMEFMNDNVASFQVIEKVDCKQIPICMDIFRRNENVMEIDLHRVLAPYHGESCHLSKSLNETIRQLIYTFVQEIPIPVPCLPLHGVYTSDKLRLANISHPLDLGYCNHDKLKPNQAFTQLRVGCNDQNSTDIYFYNSCDSIKEPVLVSQFQCIATWSDGPSTFLLASNPGLGVKGYRCFEISVDNKKDKFNVIGKRHFCKPSTGESSDEDWTFELKHEGTCQYLEASDSETSSASSCFYFRINYFNFLLSLTSLYVISL